MRVLVTGSNGFVGHAFCAQAVARGMAVRGVTRSLCNFPSSIEGVVVSSIDGSTVWRDALLGCKAVVHLAARVHVMEEASADSISEYRRVNVQGTLALAQQAAAAGVRRFVFVSTVKVNGESTQVGGAFRADDVPAPLDAYGVSKMEAEQGLRELAEQSGMEVVIIRPPLVYGPGVKANFAALMRWLKLGVPLPLGAIHNVRSLVALDNLVDLIAVCLGHPAAANQIFLVSDNEDVSTTQLLYRMGQAMGKPARLVPVPQRTIELAVALFGMQDVAQRLCGSLQVDIEKTRRLLGWKPPLTLDQGLKKAAERI